VQVEFNQACLAVNAAAQSDGADAGGDDTGAPPIHRGVVITGQSGSTDENLIAVENLIEVELGGLWQRARDSPHLQMVLPGV
jgi:hypothetical protein